MAILFTAALALSPAPANADPKPAAGATVELEQALARALAARDLAEAERLATRAVEIAQRSSEKDPRPLARALSVLAGVVNARGDPRASLPYYERALEFAEAKLGLGDPLTLAAMNNLGSALLSLGHFTSAEALLQRSFALQKKALGPDDPQLIVVLKNISTLRRRRGNFAGAATALTEAITIARARFADGAEEHIDLRLRLGGLHLDQRQLDQAAFQARTAGELLERQSKRRPELQASVSTLLADVLLERGDLDEARAEYERALGLLEPLGVAQRAAIGSLEVALGLLEMRRGQWQRAAQYTERALQRLLAGLGSEHPEVLTAANNLAWQQVAAGNPNAALELQERFAEATERLFAENLRGGSLRDKEAYAAQFHKLLSAEVSFHLQQMPTSQRAARLAFTSLLGRKGRTLDVLTQAARNVRSQGREDHRRLLDNAAYVHAKLAQTALATLDHYDPEALAEGTEYLETLNETADRMLSAHAVDVAKGRSKEPLLVRPEAVARKLPERSLLVEFVKYQPYDPRRARFGEARYAAYLLRPSAELDWVDLGPAKGIEERARAFRDALESPVGDVRAPAAAAFGAILEPVLKRAPEARHLLLAPDSALLLLPFEALVRDDRYLLESHLVSYLTSGRDVLGLGSASVAGSGETVIFANPAYGARARRGERGLLADATFVPLPGTEREAQQIAGIFSGSRVLLGDAASEVALKKLRGPGILHLATHGFFLDARPEPARTAAPSALEPGAARALVLQAAAAPTNDETAPGALLRSGVALSGANLRPDVLKMQADEEDGLLSALEVTDLDLRGTRLVVLSACETGQGDVRDGEGVFGLRRALVLAGAESLVLSFWKVDDEATTALMSDFYGQLAQGAGRAQALRAAQRTALLDPKRAHPYYWAAFVVSGDYRPLRSGQSSAPRARLPARGCACDVGRLGRDAAATSATPLVLALLVAVRRQRRRRAFAPAGIHMRQRK